MPRKTVDIFTRGAVVRNLLKQEQERLIRPCRHLHLEVGHRESYHPICDKDYADRAPAKDVAVDVTAYDGPSSYCWLKCPEDCRHFEESSDFELTVSRCQFTNSTVMAEAYPHESNDDDSEGIVFGLPPEIRSMEAQPLAAEATEKSELEFPEKVTPAWLWQHVGVGIWITLIGALFSASFGGWVLGVKSTKLGLVQDWFEIEVRPVESNESEPAEVSESKPVEIKGGRN